MNLIEGHNSKWDFFREITGKAMMVHRKYHPGLLESAYEAALKYLLEKDGYIVERQKYLPIFWDDVQLEQSYRMDLVINNHIIVELKAVTYIESQHRLQLWNYMHLTHLPYGMLINFGSKSLFSEWYYRDPHTEEIEKIRLI